LKRFSVDILPYAEIMYCFYWNVEMINYCYLFANVKIIYYICIIN
jgi:hypothetical protein